VVVVDAGIDVDVATAVDAAVVAAIKRTLFMAAV
jgi:hypothetical protein